MEKRLKDDKEKAPPSRPREDMIPLMKKKVEV